MQTSELCDFIRKNLSDADIMMLLKKGVIPINGVDHTAADDGESETAVAVKPKQNGSKKKETKGSTQPPPAPRSSPQLPRAAALAKFIEEEIEEEEEEEEEADEEEESEDESDGAISVDYDKLVLRALKLDADGHGDGLGLSRIAEMAGISKEDVSRSLKRLKDEKKIAQKGERRGARYHLKAQRG